MRLTKRDVLRIAKNDSAIARAFKISPTAVYLWGDDDPIPLLREMQLRHEIAPWAFGVDGNIKANLNHQLS